MNPLKLGVIGVGGMGGHHARSIAKLDEVTITAVADVNPDTAKLVGEEIGARSFSDYKPLIRSGEVEAILIATPHYFHPPIAQYAAQHGVHVLSEKPIAVTVKAADKMIAVCREKGVLLGIMFQQRTEPSRRKMKDMVDSGVLGDLHRVSMQAPWYRTQAYYDSGAWRGTWKGEGGGVLMNQSPHSLDQFNWIGGMPKTIQAITTTRLHNIEVDNTSLSILDYGNGKIGWFYTSTAELPGNERIEVAGERGSLIWEDGKLRHFVASEPMSEHLRTSTGSSGLTGEWHDVEVEGEPGSHLQVVQAFAQAVRQNDESLLIANGEDGLRSLELANAMLLAGYTRRETSLPLDRARFERTLEKLKAGAKPEEFYGKTR